MTTKRIHVGAGHTTPLHDTKPQIIKVDFRPIRKAENEAYLKDTNVQAFLNAIAWAEGGEYDYLFGASPKNDKWRITDFSTHPGPGLGGQTTAAGKYQITIDTWKDHGVNGMGLTNFRPDTQDLIAVSVIRRTGAIDAIVAGDFKGAMQGASKPWAALAQGPGLGNRYPKQPYKKYEDMLQKYKDLGGTAK